MQGSLDKLILLVSETSVSTTAHLFVDVEYMYLLDSLGLPFLRTLVLIIVALNVWKINVMLTFPIAKSMITFASF
jgi:hypothetical protein